MMILPAVVLTTKAASVIPPLQSPFLGISMVFMLLYIWSREYPNAQINIYGLVALKVWWKRDGCPAFEKQPTEKKSGQFVVRKRSFVTESLKKVLELMVGSSLTKLDCCIVNLVLCTVTLGAPGDAQRLDSIVGPPTKHFMLHYSFPPFSINEVAKRGGLNRREVGHGTRAEKALLAVLPPKNDFPYTVRVNSEVMASDGSTSMASVCGGSIALMDAGIPVREHVAGVSVGLRPQTLWRLLHALCPNITSRIFKKEDGLVKICNLE